MRYTAVIMALCLNVALCGAQRPGIIAHRGAHRYANTTENSITALRAAAELDIYAVELDVWITADDMVVVNHNPRFVGDSHVIQDTDFATLDSCVTLSNGEPVPTLDNFVKTAKELGIRLVVEIKPHKERERNDKAVDTSIEIVRSHGYLDMCDWISFDFLNCKRIAAELPGANVQYLNGDKSPQECREAGLSGIDYHFLKTSRKLCKEAHRQGLVVNTWTVDGKKQLRRMISNGVDYITTNEPELAIGSIRSLPGQCTECPPGDRTRAGK